MAHEAAQPAPNDGFFAAGRARGVGRGRAPSHRGRAPDAAPTLLRERPPRQRQRRCDSGDQRPLLRAVRRRHFRGAERARNAPGRQPHLLQHRPHEPGRLRGRRHPLRRRGKGPPAGALGRSCDPLGQGSSRGGAGHSRGAGHFGGVRHLRGGGGGQRGLPRLAHRHQGRGAPEARRAHRQRRPPRHGIIGMGLGDLLLT
mmetsp:Transcript_27451/g.61346  ORF Transcript_27451/g.61346 Transcript_27451/m.61346 type:complete len:200 (+) Transcript_27451:477-1076(+)